MSRKKTAAKKTSTRKKSAKKKAAGKRRKVERLPISAAAVRRLGFGCEDIVTADEQAGTEKPLAELIEKHEKLAAAWRRGQLLRHLKLLAPVAWIHIAAQKLRILGFDFSSGKDLREFLDRDKEARELWESTQVNTWIENREHLRSSASDGNVKAIQMIDEWHKNNIEPSMHTGRTDITRLTMQQVVDVIGLSRQTVTTYLKSEGFPRNEDKTFNMREVWAWGVEFYSKRARGDKSPVGLNPLQSMKAKELEMRLAERKGELLEYRSVLAGIAMRYKRLLQSSRKVDDLAIQMQGQSVERIAELLREEFQRICEVMREDYEELRLPDPAMDLFIDMLISLQSHYADEAAA